MSDVSKIAIDSTTYDVKDSVARELIKYNDTSDSTTIAASTRVARTKTVTSISGYTPIGIVNAYASANCNIDGFTLNPNNGVITYVVTNTTNASATPTISFTILHLKNV